MAVFKQDRLPRASARARRNSQAWGDDDGVVVSSGGLEFDSDGALQIKLDTDPGLALSTSGLTALVDPPIILSAAGIGLDLATNPGLVVTASKLLVDLDTDPGLALGAGGIKVLTPANSGLTVGASGILIGLDTNPGLVLGAGGMKVLTPASSGLTIGASGLVIDLDGTTLSLGASGISVSSPEGRWVVTAVQTGTYTASGGEFVRCDPSGGVFTVNLPTAASTAGRQIAVKNTTSSTNAITLDGDSAETIDGNATVAMTTAWGVTVLVSDGTNWLISSAA